VHISGEKGALGKVQIKRTMGFMIRTRIQGKDNGGKNRIY
jgi:hypothetical protein